MEWDNEKEANDVENKQAKRRADNFKLKLKKKEDGKSSVSSSPQSVEENKLQANGASKRSATEKDKQQKPVLSIAQRLLLREETELLIKYKHYSPIEFTPFPLPKDKSNKITPKPKKLKKSTEEELNLFSPIFPHSPFSSKPTLDWSKVKLEWVKEPTEAVKSSQSQSSSPSPQFAITIDDDLLFSQLSDSPNFKSYTPANNKTSHNPTIKSQSTKLSSCPMCNEQFPPNATEETIQSHIGNCIGDLL